MSSNSCCLAVDLDHQADEHAAITASRRELAHYDRTRETREQHFRVRHLASVGNSDAETAVMLGICDRTMHRIRHREPPAPHRPALPHPDDDARAAELDDTAQFVLNLACLLHEEDPNLVWGALSRLTRRQLQELAVVALAAIPINGWSATELFDWIHNLPAAAQTH